MLVHVTLHVQLKGQKSRLYRDHLGLKCPSWSHQRINTVIHILACSQA